MCRGDFLHNKAVNKILGLKEKIPLNLEEMRSNLRVTFYQVNPISEFLDSFYEGLKTSFIELGIETIEFEEALDDSGKIQSGIAVFAAGMNDDAKDMLVDRVNSLYNNPVIGLYERDCPAKPNDSNQDKLNSIISVLAYDVVHIAIFVNKESWTIGTMNGAVIRTQYDQDLKETILNSLVPKLTAQVVPPNILCDISYRHNQFDPTLPKYSQFVKDVTGSALLLKENGLIMSHTSVDSLNFKSKFHERVIRAYLDQRSGMSYGFMAWQLPLESKPAVLVADTENIEDDYTEGNNIMVSFMGKKYIVETPEVWVLSTRSGCNKTDINVSKDIIKMGLSEGRITLDLPNGEENRQDIKPSYDTFSILAHAVGNAIISSLLKTIKGVNSFSSVLESKGASIFHWHGYLEQNQIPKNHVMHGINNPPVSCSTRQSAVYSLLGKLEALEISIAENIDYFGDVHLEPHHGTNISSINNLTEIVEYLNKYFYQPLVKK